MYYVVLRVCIDMKRGVYVPAGVVMAKNDGDGWKWHINSAADLSRVGFHWPQVADQLPHIISAMKHITRWLEEGYRLPYDQSGIEQHSKEWWEYVSGLLKPGMRVDEPLAIDMSRNLQSECWRLYEELVAADK